MRPPEDEGSLPRRLARLCEDRFSGILLVYHGRRFHRVQLYRGLVLGARISGHFDPLGQILLQQGKLSPRALAASLERLTRGEQLQGQLLCRMGLVSPAEVERALRRQLRDRLVRLLGLGTPGQVRALPEGERLGGPCRPLHPLEAVWSHVERLPARHLLDFRRRLSGLSVSVRPGPALPWLPGHEEADLILCLRRPVEPTSLSAAGVRTLLFLWLTGSLTLHRPTPAPTPAATLRRAFRRRALQLHPDRHPQATPEEKARLAERFALEVAAYRRQLREAAG